jgi:cytochrome c-type biogenesis protein CcmH
MIAFVIAAVLLATVALALLSRPWWRRHHAAEHSRRALNAAIYRDELAELESDRASGQLGEADYEHARAELQRRLLEDAGEGDAQATARSSRTALFGLIAALPLAAVGLYLWLGNPGALTQTAPQNPPLTAADVDRMVATLAAKLEKEPDNLQGWAMLARSYKVLRRTDEAARAFEKAWPVVQQDPQLLADYADLLASNAGGNLDGRPEQLIDMALKLDPNHLQSLWLAGTAAYNHNDFGKAADLWQRALAQLPPESEDAKMLASVIGEARSKQGVGKAPAAAAATAVSGRVELAANLKGQASPDDTLFILARGDDGPMPLAVLRARVADLPMDFRLDDSNAVMPTRTLSSAKSVRIEARVSKAGDALSKPGDLSGSTGPVKPGAKNLRIRIDKVVQ